MHIVFLSGLCKLCENTEDRPDLFSLHSSVIKTISFTPNLCFIKKNYTSLLYRLRNDLCVERDVKPILAV